MTTLYDTLKYPTNDATKLAALGKFDAVLGLDLLKKAEQRRRETQAEQAAGAAAAMTDDFAALDVKRLQAHLVGKGVKL